MSTKVKARKKMRVRRIHFAPRTACLFVGIAGIIWGHYQKKYPVSVSWLVGITCWGYVLYYLGWLMLTVFRRGGGK